MAFALHEPHTFAAKLWLSGVRRDLETIGGFKAAAPLTSAISDTRLAKK